MAKHLFVVATYALPGRKAELDAWYADQHIPDLLAVPGIVRATRHAVTAVKLPDGVETPDCLTIYDLVGEDPMIVLDELSSRQGTPQMVWTDALDSTRTIALLATPQDAATEG